MIGQILQMPTLVNDLLVDSDTESESEEELFPKTPPPTTLPPYVNVNVFSPTPQQQQQRKHILTVSSNHRIIAGSRRVLKFRDTLGLGSNPSVKNSKDENRNDIMRGQGECEDVLQSITATPALGHQSFEELRMECYLQSQVATGSPPKAVDPIKTPWEVLPPAFNAVRAKDVLPANVLMSPGCNSSDVVMSD